MKRLLFTLLLITSTHSLRAGISEPCLAVKIPLSDRIASASAVVYGNVVSQKAVWDDAQRSIYTINRVLVSDVWKQTDLVGDTITVITEGGDMGTMGRTVIGTLKLDVGDEGFLLLEATRANDTRFTRSGVTSFFRPYAEVQALFAQTEDGAVRDCWGVIANTTARVEQRFLSNYPHETRVEFQRATPNRNHGKAAEVLQGAITFSPERVIGGMGDPLTIRGAGFGAQRGSSYVTFTTDGTNYHSAEAAQGFAYRSWSDTEIVIEVPPSYSGKVRVVVGTTVHESADNVRVTSNLAARSLSPLVYNNLITTNTNGGYTWAMDKVLFDNADARACVESVMRQFRCKTGMNFDVAQTPATAGYALNDGINAIVFDAPGYELGAGAVAYCDWIWYSCILGTETFYWVRDTDCRLSRKFNWYYGNGKNPEFGMAKLRYVLYHEIGHAHQFGHVSEWGESMHPIVQALPAEEWLERDTITASEQRVGKFFTERCRSFTFRACGVQPLLAPSTDDCNTDPTSDVEDDHQHADLALAPQPSDDVVVLTDVAGDAPERSVEILDLRGTRVSSSTWPMQQQRITLDVRPLATGQYVIVVRDARGVQRTQPLIIQR